MTFYLQLSSFHSGVVFQWKLNNPYDLKLLLIAMQAQRQTHLNLPVPLNNNGISFMLSSMGFLVLLKTGHIRSYYLLGLFMFIEITFSLNAANCSKKIVRGRLLLAYCLNDCPFS